MNTSTQKHRTGLVIGGAVVALLAALVLAVAGLAISTEVDHRDGSGYLTTDAHRYATPTRAIATDEVTIGTEVPESLIGKVRLEASSAKPVFVGIAPTAKVDAYLAGTSYTTVKDLDLSPFAVTYRTHQGTAHPAPPASQRFWAASVVGTDAAELTWKPKSGSWSIVVMNADGSPGVAADVTAGAKVPWLLWAAIGTVIGGTALLAVAVFMLVKSFRGRRDDPSPGTALVPAV